MKLACRRLIEAGWLAVVILLPLFFNPFTVLPFEPAKVALFWVVVAGMVAAAGASLLAEQKGSPSASFPRYQAILKPKFENPLLLPVLIYAGAYLLATAASIDPVLSLWGSSHRPYGIATLLGTVIFFVLVAGALQRQEQVERLSKALLFGSVPVAFYGLVQYLGQDPLNWTTDSISPVLSTMGRSNFLGAYLAMVIPFTLSRLVTGDGAWSPRYAVVLALQVACLLFTLARGAWLGFLGGCLLFLWLLASRWRSRGLLAVSIVVLLVGSWLFIYMYMNEATPPLWASGKTTGVAQGSGPTFGELRVASTEDRIAIWRNTLGLA